VTVEAIPGGGLVPSSRFDTIRLMEDYEGFGLFMMICQGLFVAFTIYFSVLSFKALCKEKTKFFQVRTTYN
jgi:hypothetical protein